MANGVVLAMFRSCHMEPVSIDMIVRKGNSSNCHISEGSWENSYTLSPGGVGTENALSSRSLSMIRILPSWNATMN